MDRSLLGTPGFDSRCRGVHEAFVASKGARLLATTPFFGEFTSVALIAGLGPVDRFPDNERLGTYTGLVPTRTPSSETSFQGHGKEGSNALVQ